MSELNSANRNRSLPVHGQRGTGEAPESVDSSDDAKPPPADDPPAGRVPSASSAGEVEPYWNRSEADPSQDLAGCAPLLLVPPLADTMSQDELRAANQRLEERVATLETMNVDLAALLDGTDVGTVFLDTALRLRRLNPAATRLLDLSEADIGRPLPDDSTSLASTGVRVDLAAVLADLQPRQSDVGMPDGRWFVRRTTPYRTALGDVAGVMVTLTEETARKMAAEQSRLLAAVLMTIHDAFILHDFEGRILVWNQGAERLYGYTEEEATRSNADIIIPEELRGTCHSLWEEIERGKTVDQWETCRVTKDGRRVDVWVVATLVRDAFGAPVAIAKVDRDVSDIKRTERELAALQSQLMSDLAAMKRLHEFSTVFIHADSVEELLEQAMAAAVELTGATRGVMHVIEPETDSFRLVTQRGLDRPFLDFYGRVLASEFEKILPTHSKRFIVEDVRSHPMLRDRPKDRDRILASGIQALQSTPLYARSGRLVGILTTHYSQPHRPTDREFRLLDLLARQVADLLERTETVADLRQSQDALRRSNETLEQRVADRTAELRDQMELFRTILSTAITGILNFDGQGIIRLVNPSVERMFKYTASEMMGMHVSQLIPGLDPGMLSRLDDDDSNGTTREVRGVRKDQSDIPLAMVANRVDHRDLCTAILLDLSRRKELEREVVHISTQEQQRIGQFLHDDCGQQLTALSLTMDGLVDSLQDSPDKAKIARRVADGVRAVLRKIRHISHGLALTEVEPESLGLALEELVTQINETPGIRCVYRIDMKTTPCDCHTATQLYHMATEMCTNALKHSNCSNIHMEFTSRKDSIILVVEDDGVGIPDGISKGLGLRIMRNRASVIGAQLKVERRPGGGTRVVCTKRLEPSATNSGGDLAE